MTLRSLQQRLRELGYVELFQRLDDHAITSLWNEPDAPEALARLALDRSADPLTRFLAAEVVLSMDPKRFGEQDHAELAEVYAAALRGQFTLSANEWSFPDGFPGHAGQHFISLGPAAVPALRPLLDDDTPVLYEGSKEAMVAAEYCFRIRDLAASFLAKILGVPFSSSQDPRARNTAIAALKSRL
ncbi:MAG TPA: hypothetical protein VNA69_09830 [Thermoanaerobaculia bacterium]|nr:hypothetical protein [Thermoanaerobaculia bacterium]